MNQDTIAIISTAMTAAGIGIIRISGPDAFNIIEKIYKSKKKNKQISKEKSHTIHYGYIIDKENNKYIDEVLVSIMKEPNTYTRENIVEINSHGGLVVMKEILSLVIKNGARLAEPGEFTKRAFLNGRIDLSQAEAVMDIIYSKTQKSLHSSVKHLKGDLGKKIGEIKDKVLEIIAYIEVSIDYPEYDYEEIEKDELIKRLKEIEIEMKKLYDSYKQGKLIKEGIKTAIVGKPNVGKSSILNMLLNEERAIITNIPGTTRDTIEEYISISGIPLKLIDTAGIRKTSDLVESIGIEKSKEAIVDADLTLLILDSSKELDSEDKEIIKIVKDKLGIVLINKIDLGQEKIQIDYIEKELNWPILRVSALEKKGLDDLKDLINVLIVDGKLNQDDEIFITNERHKNLLEEGLEAIKQAYQAIEDNMTEDIYSIDLKNVYNSLSKIKGEFVEDDILNQIFSKFCLGK